MHVLDNRGEVWKTFVVLIPTLGAALIAVSRIMDARHHPFDVISGSLLGIVVAWAAYRQYFPPVTESWRKGRAYPIRTWATEPKGPPGMEYNGLVRDQGAEPHQNHDLALDPQASNIPQRTNTAGGRQGDLPEHSFQSSSSSLDLEGRHLRKPLPSAQRQVRRTPSDGYWSSSSDRDLNADAFEMQNVSVPSHGPTNMSAADAFGKDTSYHPPDRDSGYLRPHPQGEPSRSNTELNTTSMR